MVLTGEQRPGGMPPRCRGTAHSRVQARLVLLCEVSEGSLRYEARAPARFPSRIGIQRRNPTPHLLTHFTVTSGLAMRQYHYISRWLLTKSVTG